MKQRSMIDDVELCKAVEFGLTKQTDCVPMKYERPQISCSVFRQHGFSQKNHSMREHLSHHHDSPQLSADQSRYVSIVRQLRRR